LDQRISKRYIADYAAKDLFRNNQLSLQYVI
jgi:hypothetical protein